MCCRFGAGAVAPARDGRCHPSFPPQAHAQGARAGEERGRGGGCVVRLALCGGPLSVDGREAARAAEAGSPSSECNRGAELMVAR